MTMPPLPPQAGAAPSKDPLLGGHHDLARGYRDPRMGRKVAIGGVVAAVLAIGGCMAFSANVANQEKNATHTVVFEVTGSAASTVVSFDVVRQGAVRVVGPPVVLPWRKSVTVKGVKPGAVNLSAHGSGPGTLRCSLTVDGVVVRQDAGQGKHPSVSCNYASTAVGASD